MKEVCTHFFGFRGDEYNRAKRIWGEPDFIHPVHDRRAYIEIDKEKDILIFVESKESEILKRLKKRKNFNMVILNNFKKMQLSLVLKKKKSQFIIKNNFKKNSVKVRVNEIIKNLV